MINEIFLQKIEKKLIEKKLLKIEIFPDFSFIRHNIEKNYFNQLKKIIFLQIKESTKTPQVSSLETIQAILRRHLLLSGIHVFSLKFLLLFLFLCFLLLNIVV